MGNGFHDECAVIGVWGSEEAANLCYLGLYALQHRGQEGAGIVSCDGEEICGHKEMGLVADVFPADVIAGLRGRTAIGHTRYATCGSKDWQNLQPFVANVGGDAFAVAHNGNLTNTVRLRRELESRGAIFSSTSDTEVIMHLIAHERGPRTFAERIRSALSRVEGAYSLVFLRPAQSLFAARDPHGIRPLIIGKRADGGYVIASESCAFDLLSASMVRDVRPGELVEITPNGELVSHGERSTSRAHCVFEYIYFARPDSTIDGRNVYMVRKKFGAELAREHPIEADIVVPIPDSGFPAGMGYAEASGLPLELGLIRNHYVGRTFIEPKQSIRDFGVKIKLHPIKEILNGKRVVLVDDSIVRGTTSRKLISLIREAGAREVHFRVSSPPTIRPCHYGVDTPSREELIASSNTVEQIRTFLGADSLGYLSFEGMYRALGESASNFCDACFSGRYRAGKIEEPSVQIQRKEERREEPAAPASRASFRMALDPAIGS